MRLKRAQAKLNELNIKFKYSEKDNFGKLFIGNKKVYEYLDKNGRNTFIMAEEINLINETQLIGWIQTNEDRLKRNNY